MNFTIKILVTDALFFVLVISACMFIFYARKHEHLSSPWRRILTNRLAMSALVILLSFILPGLLDSFHFRQEINSEAGIEKSEIEYSGEVVSLLDLLLTDIRTHTEKTYSAPFATHSFTKEVFDNERGSPVMAHVRLKYGGAHLKDNESRVLDISKRAALSLFWTVIVIFGSGVLVSHLYKREGRSFKNNILYIFGGKTEIPWNVILLTMAFPVFFVFCILNMGSLYHILGTDQVGNDVMFKAIKSIRTGLLIGTLTTLIMLPFAVILGIMSGYFRGWVDDVIQYIYTTLSSIPGVLLIAAAILSLDVYMGNHPQSFASLVDRSDSRLLFLCMILGIMSWTSLCRLLRAETLKIREQDYIQAAISLGVRSQKIMSRHIFPNLMHIVLISIVLDFSSLVLAEAVLSYVGVGVDPTMDSWGNMINGARLEMAREPLVWWNLVAAFIFMFVLVLSANIFSDAVRDAFDPRLRSG